MNRKQLPSPFPSVRPITLPASANRTRPAARPACSEQSALLGEQVRARRTADRGTLLDESHPRTPLPESVLEFLHMLSGSVSDRDGSKAVHVAAGDSLLSAATAPDGIDSIVARPAAFLSVLFALRD